MTDGFRYQRRRCRAAEPPPVALLSSRFFRSVFITAAPIAAADDVEIPLALEEVLVTARKREENLQNIPIAVSALNATQISNGNFRDLRDIASMSPNLIIDHISASPQAAAISLRGINFPGSGAQL